MNLIKWIGIFSMVLSGGFTVFFAASAILEKNGFYSGVAFWLAVLGGFVFTIGLLLFFIGIRIDEKKKIKQYEKTLIQQRS